MRHRFSFSGCLAAKIFAFHLPLCFEADSLRKVSNCSSVKGLFPNVLSDTKRQRASDKGSFSPQNQLQGLQTSQLCVICFRKSLSSFTLMKPLPSLSKTAKACISFCCRTTSCSAATVWFLCDKHIELKVGELPRSSLMMRKCIDETDVGTWRCRIHACIEIEKHTAHKSDRFKQSGTVIWTGLWGTFQAHSVCMCILGSPEQSCMSCWVITSPFTNLLGKRFPENGIG